MGKYEEVLEEGRGPKVPRSRGPKDQDISNSHSNTSLTLKKVHLVNIFCQFHRKFHISKTDLIDFRKKWNYCN